MVKKLTVSELASLIRLDHDVADYMKCELGEWVQWLITQCDNPNFFMWGNVEEGGTVDAYIVAFYQYLPPIKNDISVLYSLTGGRKANSRVLKEMIEWGKGKGARSIEFVTLNPVGHSVYGFKTAGKYMRMEI